MPGKNNNVAGKRVLGAYGTNRPGIIAATDDKHFGRLDRFDLARHITWHGKCIAGAQFDGIACIVAPIHATAMDH